MNLKATISPIGNLNAKQSVAGGGKGGATDWAHLKDKPFETLGDDFTVDNGELQIAEGVIPAVSATATLSSGTEVGSVEVNGITTTFYAPNDNNDFGLTHNHFLEIKSGSTLNLPIYDSYIGGGLINNGIGLNLRISFTRINSNTIAISKL